MNYLSYWQEAIDYLSEQDSILFRLISQYTEEKLKNNQNIFETLTKSIIGQQISVKAANSISLKLKSLIGAFTPENYLVLDNTNLKKCGLSKQKIRYINNVANAIQDHSLTPEAWSVMSNEEIEAQLKLISGVGTWTAQMFLIFHLGRQDILPISDIGLLKAVSFHYNSGKQLDKASVIKIAEVWRPYRTVATWYLWRSLDPIPVQY